MIYEQYLEQNSRERVRIFYVKNTCGSKSEVEEIFYGKLCNSHNFLWGDTYSGLQFPSIGAVLKTSGLIQPLNWKKPEVMVVSGNNECPQVNIFINERKLKHRDQLKYLGTLISSVMIANAKEQGT